jgi:hypothetical protein
MDKTVGVELGITAFGECQLELQVAVAKTPGLVVTENLRILHQGDELEVVEVEAPHDGRLHLVTLPDGFSQVFYDAQVGGKAETAKTSLADLSLYRRPSRYIESDTFGGFALSEFEGLHEADLLKAVSSWVGSRLLYIPGSSGPSDGAVDERSGSRPGSRLSMRRAATRWTFMPSSRRTCWAAGTPWTRAPWPRASHWCGSRRGATQRIQHS